MVMNHQRQQRLKPLLDKVPPGCLVDTRWLKAQSIDAKSIHNYVARGWLERLIRGVYRRPLPEGVAAQPVVSWVSTLLSLQWIMQYDVHLGGLSALNLAGHAHYLYLGQTPRVHVYGDTPAWLKRLPTDTPIDVHQRTLFGDDPTGIVDADQDNLPSNQPMNAWRWPLKVSSPERAVLEALDRLPSDTSFSHMDKIFESLTTLRPRQLMKLLVTCRRVKVRRLFFVFADRHQHAWRKHLDTDQIDFGTGPRALVEGGKLHPTYRIYVPRAFVHENNTEPEAHG